VIYAFYADCDPISAERIKKGDQILPYFVMHVLGSLYGVPGLFVACLFSGTLSTVSSGLNSLAAVVLEDFIRPWCRNRQMQLSEIRATLYSKLLAFGFGVLTIGLSFLATRLGAILQLFYSVFGVVGGPVVGAFCLGMFTRRAHSRGVYIGLLLGFAVGLWIGIGAKVYLPPVTKAPLSTEGCKVNVMSINSTVNSTSAPPPKEYEGRILYRISWLWYSAVCFAVTYITGLLVSVLWRGNHDGNEIDARLLFRIDYCLPNCTRKSSEGKQDEQQQLNKAESEETKQNGEASKSGPHIDDEQEYPEGPLLMTTRM